MDAGGNHSRDSRIGFRPDLLHFARFARFLTTQAKAAGIPAVLLAADKEMDETLYAKVAQFCDQTLKPAPRTTRRARRR